MPIPIIFLGISSIILYTLFLNAILYKKIKQTYNVSQNTTTQKYLKVIFVIFALLIMIVLSMTGALVMICYSILAIMSLFLIFKFKIHITTRDVMIALILSAIVYVTTRIISGNPNSISWLMLNTILTFLAYLGGVSLIRSENLGHLCQFSKNSFKKFFLGMIMVTPPALLNAFATYNDDHIISWLHTLTAIKPAIFEELLFRLLLMTVFMVIGSKKEANITTYPVLFASLLSSIIFALLHGFNPVGNLIIIVLYAIPLSFIYVLYGLEATIGAHFITDFIRFASVFVK